jgi:integrase/recombinase XerD
MMVLGRLGGHFDISERKIFLTKINRFGKAEILNPQEITLLFTEEFLKPRDRALFGICLFTGCRVSEALALKKTDIKSGSVTFRKCTNCIVLL